MNRKVIIRFIIITIGIGMVLVSIFAFQLGLDNNPELGKTRFVLLGIGLTTILFGSLYWITPLLLATHLQKNINQPVQTNTTRPQNSIITITLLILLSIIVVYVYIWVTTIGRMEKWPSSKDYYWKLTQAFQNGQTHLLEEPNPALANVENVYDFQQRKGLDYLWDATYYDGKYFLYWGPAPAVIGIFVTAITSKPVTDVGLVFSFVLGTVLFSILLLYEMYKYLKIPTWAFWGSVCASAINVPIIWLLTRPSFYEVSISGGQFFMMAGFYFLFLGFKDSKLNIRLITASTLTFGLAGATRINLLPSICLLAAFILWRIYTLNHKQIRASLPAFVFAILPLALIAVSLSWYNYNRFGSIFEFGHRYQLTGPALTANYSDISSLQYIIPNAYSYILRPPSFNEEFPFFTLPNIKKEMWPSFITLPKHYNYTEPTAGFLIIIPIIGLASLLFIRFCWLAINGDISLKQVHDYSENNLFSWFGLSLLGYILIQLFVLLIFLYGSVRYTVDISPALIIFSTILIAYYVKTVDTNPYLIKIISMLWVVMSILTVAMGFVIGITGDRNNFLNQNPTLFFQMMEWFSK